MDVASSIDNPVQCRPAKLTISSDAPMGESRSQSGGSPTRVLLSCLPPGYRTPPYTSGSSSGGSSPTSVSSGKNDQTHFNFDHRSLDAQPAPNGVYMKNGASVQQLTLKRHDPPKQLLSLASRQQQAVQDVCAFCYQVTVHYAKSKYQRPLPRVSERGPWSGHVLKEGDRIVCPRALRRVCPLCGATGQKAHLDNFCPIAKKHTSSY